MRILITGADGMLGTELQAQLKREPARWICDCPALDVADLDAVDEAVARCRPDAVIHLAAKTNLEWCEKNPDACRLVNVQGTENAANAALRSGALLVYASTFYVYAGDKGTPYDERYDAVEPEKIVGVYSKSKWEGEEVVRARKNLQQITPRFGALFGGGRRDKKFVAKVLDLVKSGKKEIQMVNDRVIQPSSIKDTARNLIALIEKGGRGVFNMVGRGHATYYEYAQAILEFAGIKDVKVTPISADTFKEGAPRAKQLLAVNGRLGEMGLDLMRDWRTALKEYIEENRSELL